MSRIILVCGGSRSGKSSYAQKKAESMDGPRLFIATCPRIDSEIDGRIEKHILERQGRGWETIEEQLNIAEVMRENMDSAVILVDCLTLWVNNLLFEHNRRKRSINEEDIVARTKQILMNARNHFGTLIFVTNEVGSGIVPGSSETRLYRDLVGRCNQCVASEADEVVLVSCGIPLILKSV